MDIQTLILIGMFLALIAFTLTLYHLAHGNERKAVEQGARLVLESLQRQGRIAPEQTAPVEDGPVNIGEEDYERFQTDEAEYPEIIIARNRKAAEQMGDAISDDIMRAMDEAQKK